MKPEFILGAKDPEMDRIEEILKLNSIPYEYAMVDDKRCHPGNAYTIPAEHDCWYVECGKDAINRIDHHRPGDPGWGSDAIQSSSLFQLLDILEVEPTKEDYTIAALDVNGAKALQGGYPEVTTEDALLTQATNIATANNTSVNKVMDSIQYYHTQFDWNTVPYLGVGYNIELLAYLTVSAMLNMDIMYEARDSDESPLKICFKSTDQSKVEAFMNQMEADGLINIYGNPTRGYCGGYYPE